MRSLEIEKSKIDECSGFRAFEDCPHNGLFTKGSKACKECCDDALASFDEEVSYVE